MDEVKININIRKNKLTNMAAFPISLIEFLHFSMLQILKIFITNVVISEKNEKIKAKLVNVFSLNFKCMSNSAFNCK